MKRARIAFKGAAVWADLVDNDSTLRLGNGETISATEAHWLAPVTPGPPSHATWCGTM